MTGTNDSGQFAILQTSANATTPALVRGGMAPDGPDREPIPAGQSRVVNFDLPACAVTNSHYLLYLNQFPLELSLELYANGASCCLPGAILDAAGGAVNLGTDFEVSEVEFKADLLVLDSGTMDAIDKGLLAGAALNMTLRCWS